MSVLTKSAFYYGITIDNTNNKIDFDEGSGEITATLNEKSYSLTDFGTEIQRALNEVGGQTYTVTLARSTRFFTISASSNFDLLTNTGSNTGQSIWSLAGFSTTADKTGSNSYTSDSAAGFAYLPQFKLQRFVDFNDSQSAAQSSVNESANGDVQVVSFGTRKFMECNITFATDYAQKSGSPIEQNLTGVSDLRDFMEYATTKGFIEFVPDRDTPANFTKCILERTRDSRDGTAFTLRELYTSGLIGYFETGRISFREVS